MKATSREIDSTPSAAAQGFTFYTASIVVGDATYAVSGALCADLETARALRREAQAGDGDGGPWLSVRARLRRPDGSDGPWLLDTSARGTIDGSIMTAIREALHEPLGIVAGCGRSSCRAVYTAETWPQLELVGDVDGALEQRNCVCGSTCSAEVTS
jgi:hypothetical protein